MLTNRLLGFTSEIYMKVSVVLRSGCRSLYRSIVKLMYGENYEPSLLQNPFFSSKKMYNGVQFNDLQNMLYS